MIASAALSAQPQVGETSKKLPETKGDKTDAKSLAVKLPDGTFLLLGAADGVTLSPQDFQRLSDRAEALKKELAARKPVAPHECVIGGRLEKRGDQLVAALKLTYTFRTAQPNAAVALGGRRAFATGAALDGAKQPVLETADDGLAVLVEAAGAHALVLDLEAPVTARGTKAEIGFEFGLPRAPVTKFALEVPGDVKRLALVTKTPDPPKLTEPRRFPVDAKQLAPGGAGGFPLGPVESLEVVWDPPAVAARPADQVSSADLDVGVVLTDGFAESTAKFKVRGPGRELKLVAPPAADVSVERVAAAGDTGPAQLPVVIRPGEPDKPVWRIALPADSTGADWLVTAVVRQARPKAGTASAPVPVGPFGALDVLRQTGTVTVKAGPHHRFVFRHGPDLRRADPAGGAADDELSVAQFKLTTGPTGSAPVDVPLLTVEAVPVEGAVRVRPVYRLDLAEGGASWRVRAEINVRPIRTELDALTVEVPAEWRGLESEFDPEAVQGVGQGKGDGTWLPVTVRLARPTKQPFSVVLVGAVAVPAGTSATTVPLPRFPHALERDAAVTATVPEGLELHGTWRDRDGEHGAATGAALGAAPRPDGVPPKVPVSVTGRAELGAAGVALSWRPPRPDMTAEVRTDVTVGERQLVVSQALRLRAADGFARPVRLRGPADALGLKAVPALDAVSPGVWSFVPAADTNDQTVRISFALPLPGRTDGPVAVPVGLFWPAEAARTEATVRVWVSSMTGRTVSAAAPGWRELPPEVIPERDTLPALTLGASAEHPFAVELHPAPPESAAAVWVDRALIEAGATEDGSVSYRARFRLVRWLAPAVEVWLPNGTGPSPAARLDGLVAPLQPAGEANGGRLFRVLRPELPAGRAAVLEVQYALPGTRQAVGETLYVPPRVTAAAYSGPVRWLITEPSGSAPLLLGGRARAELRWRWRGAVFAPSAAPRAELERWFASGDEPLSGAPAPLQEGEPLAARQLGPEPVPVARAPWTAVVVVCSLVVFLLVVLLAWLNPVAAALAVAALGGGFAVAAVLYPQPATQAVAAAQPGLVFGLVAVAAQAAVRWEVRRRVRYLPGFTRTLPAPTASATTSPSPSVPSRPGAAGTPAPTGSGA
ncbi:hypothetical protein R5W24_003802 [Gemmata sp. JC717]|uniref:hypothetical protein n=1 Tax=Gemmata algarum TaxID=2975278 RepID=UPI0021BA9D0A|nr:hypothetical protein [Gemmata algarum]MDY3554676.1 hypothetical protein [Gemmata algarum]